LGVTARFGTIDSRRYVNVGGRHGALTFDADQSARTIDVYGEGRYRLGRFSLIAGAVYTNGERRQDQLFPIPMKGDADFEQVSPRFGLLWEPRADLQVYANYSRSHELPGFIELAQVASFVPLAEQHAFTAEVGARGRLGIASFDLTFYRARLDGELLQFAIGPDIPASTFNAGDTLHQGIEAALELALAPWARLRQVYQFNDFRFRNDLQFGDNRLPVIPRHVYRADLRLGSDRLSVTPGLEWLPDGAWADYANSLKLGGYALVGATAEARIRPGLSLFVEGRNLANRRAVGDISAVVDYRTLTPTQRAIFYPVERRSLYGGLRATF
jgi:iron complex outermembrane receptor protein